MPLRPLSKDLQEVIETTQPGALQRLPDDIKHLQEWLRQQPHLNARDDEQWLAAFLMCSKHNVEVTKEKIDSYYATRSFAPEYFSSRDPHCSDIQTLLNNGNVLPLPNPLGDRGPRIVLTRLKGGLNLAAGVTLCGMYLDILLNEDDHFNVGGVIFWVDLESVSFDLIKQATPMVVKKMVTCLQAYPMRIKQLHYTNGMAVVEVVIDLLKLFLKDKLKDRLHYHSVKNTKTNFPKYIPEEYLPREYGGENGSLSELTEYWKQKVESYKEWFEEDAQYGCDEKLRVLAAKTTQDRFSKPGLFRKLNVD